MSNRLGAIWGVLAGCGLIALGVIGYAGAHLVGLVANR